MKPTQKAQHVLNTATELTHYGKKPLAQRRSLGLMLGGVLLGASALLSAPEVNAQSWQDMVRQDQSSSNRYNTNETLRSANIRLAKVVQVDRDVTIENGNRVNVGAVIGAGVASGLVNDRNIRNSSQRTAARVLAAGIGGLVGQKTQQRFTRDKGVRIVVLEDNRLTSIVQKDDGAQYRSGDLVMLESGSGRLRVSHVSPQMKQELMQVMNEGYQGNNNRQPSYQQRYGR